MITCQQCDRQHELNQNRVARFCPYCGADMHLQENDSWATLLRLHSSAEAGFLADQLEQNGVAARLAQHDEFSAVDGTWQIRYLLLVRQENALEAARHIKEVLDAPDAERQVLEAGGQSVYAPDANDEPTSAVVPWWAWAGVVVGILAVGSYFVERRPIDPAEAPDNDQLMEVLRAGGGMWTKTRTADEPAVSLYFDEQDQLWVLDEDVNGDQVPERRRLFRQGELVFDSRQ